MGTAHPHAPHPCTSSTSSSCRSREFAEKAYLDYSMYVILDRALPHLADGLKPVQRRIIYAMSRAGARRRRPSPRSRRAPSATSSASSIRTATSPATRRWCSMAQPFSYRYPLIDGQGNWGSPRRSEVVRGDALHRVAAHAVSRSRCSPSWGRARSTGLPNFDGTLRGAEAAAGAAAARAAQRRHRHRGRHGHRHPAAQPARGRRAPASGCSTIPTRTVREAVRTRSAAPDYPDRRPRSSRRARRSGRCTRPATGTIRARAHVGEGGRRHRHHRAAVPGLAGARCIEQIAAADARQEAADGGGPARRVRPREPDAPGDRAALATASTLEQLMAHLFATTDLERTLPRQHEHDRPRRPAAGQEPQARCCCRMAELPHRDGPTPAAASGYDEGRPPPAHPRRLAGRLSSTSTR